MRLPHPPARRAGALVATLACAALPPLAACAPRVAATATAAPERTATVLVYNVHAGADARGADNLARVAALVRETDADVALLQEVDRGVRRSRGVDQPAELARLTGRHVAFGKTLDYQGGDYGIAVLSRWPIRRDTLVRLPVDPPQASAGRAHEPRGALVVTLDAPGGPLAVINSHIDASRDDGYRRQEMRTLVSLARALRADGAPVLVGGDMNSEPGSAVQDSARAGGLRDAWLVCGRGPSLTYPADSGVKRIDYLYLTGDATCDEARVLRSDASDHSPVLVRIRF